MRTLTLTAALLFVVLASRQTALHAQDVANPGLLDPDLLDPENFGQQRSSPSGTGQQGPLTQVAGKMGVVVQDLGEISTGDPTQEKQKQIVNELDKLIAQLEKQCAACCRSGNASANPKGPAARSAVRRGPGGSGDLHDPRDHGKRWGQLPAHQRDRILQSMTEGFPPHYQRILERYYRRIASGEKTDDRPEDDSASNKSVMP